MPAWWSPFNGWSSTAPTSTTTRTYWAVDQGVARVYTSAAATATTTSTWIMTAPTPTTSSVWYQQQLDQQPWAQQALAQQQTLWVQPEQLGQERYQYQLARPTGLGSLFTPCTPAIISHREAARRDMELYRRALEEHDLNEAARLRRMVDEHERLDSEQRREEQLEQERTREAAKLRARELLFEYLTPQQRETFDHNGWFVVQGGKSKTQYRIRAVESMVANVDVLLHGGRVKHRLCAHIRVGTVPLGDQLLAQKVMIELAEDDFLRVANRHHAA